MNLKKISNDIPQIVREWGEEHAGKTHFSYVVVLSYIEGEIIERAFALRNYSKKGLLITEVRRRATGTDSEVLVKNLLTSMFGYIPVFEKENRYSHNGGYSFKIFSESDYDHWYSIKAECNLEYICLNSEILKDIPEFKYSGYQHGDVIKYLNEYRQNPGLEFFGKLDLPISKSLAKKAQSDTRFRKFLFTNADEVRIYGIQRTIYAYNHNLSFYEADKILTDRRIAYQVIPSLRKTNVDCLRIIEWCKKNKINTSSYNDYFEAIKEMRYDLSDTKNLYPKDFKAIHDLRIAEYDAYKEKLDRKKRKALYENFAKAGEKAVAYEYSEGGFTMIAPRDIRQLKSEGKALGHCVGKMGYDKKMADGKVVIMFLRYANNIEKPFVTVEYDLKGKRLLQAHGKGNCSAPEDAKTFISKWVELMKELTSKKVKQ